MFTMTEAEAARWERRRRRGVWLHVTLFVLVAVGLSLLAHQFFGARRPWWLQVLRYGVLGACLGTISWHTSELGYLSWLKNRRIWLTAIGKPPVEPDPVDGRRLPRVAAIVLAMIAGVLVFVPAVLSTG